MVIRALGAVSTYILVQSGPPPGMGIEPDYCKDGTVVSEQSLSMVAIMKLCTLCCSVMPISFYLHFAFGMDLPSLPPLHIGDFWCSAHFGYQREPCHVDTST
jgi:hypothetical protein